MRNSRIILAKNINLDRNYKNVLNYTESQMLNLVNANKIGESNFNSFIRQNGNTIPTNFSYNQALQANYIAFQNPDYSQKWFFAWIDEIVYKNDSNIEIKYTIDAWSTWFEKLQLKNCFIVRETVADDSIGLHTIPEDLNVGEVVQEGLVEDVSFGQEFGYWIAIQSNWKPNDNVGSGGSQFSGISVYNNTVSGVELFLFKIGVSNEIIDARDFSNVTLFILRTLGDRHIEDIQNMFILPNRAIDESEIVLHTATVTTVDGSPSFSWYTANYSVLPNISEIEIDKITSFNGLNIKNNKCFCYPYNYLFVTNNNGNHNIYKYEDFNTNKCKFETQFAITIGGSGRIVPKNYKGMTSCDDESLPVGKYPTCSWSSDAFINWLTQNGVNIVSNLALTAGGIAAAVATGGASVPLTAAIMAGTATAEQTAQYNNAQLNQGMSIGLSASKTIAGTIGSFYQASLLPNIQIGQNSGDVLWSCDRNIPEFRQMRVKDEYIQIIDSYFSRFGYKVNRLGTPNLTSRTYWNYIEIGQGEQVGFGEIPSVYLQVINRAFETGVTIWHNHTNIGNYNLNNTIV